VQKTEFRGNHFLSLRWRRSGHPRLFLQGFSAGEPEKVIATPFGFIASSNCILYERAKPLFVDIEPDTANIDPNLIEDAIISRYVIRVGVDEPAPERQPPRAAIPRAPTL